MAPRKQTNGNEEQQVVPQHAAMPTLPDESTLPDRAGEGISYDQADRLMPLVYVLQTGSPQVNPSGPAYVEGARAGDILLRNSIPPTVTGSTGIFFQPCYLNKVWIEWVPRTRGGGGGQGFVARHMERPAEAVQRQDPNDPNKQIWSMPNGNVVQETRQHFGLVHLRGEFANAPDGQKIHMASGFSAYVIPMTSTGHTISRQWNTMQAELRTPSGKRLNAYDQIWRLTLRQRSNAKGTWYTWAVTYMGRANTEEALAGKALFDECARGDREAEQPVHDEAADVVEQRQENAPF